jgi:hypothetical protein
MPEWDTSFNSSNKIGYLTVYTPDYSSDLMDFRMKFSADKIDYTIERLQRHIRHTQERIPQEELEDITLVGMNSNSLTSSFARHNLFLEWDKKHYVPDMEELSSIGGVMVETQNGIHIVKEADLEIPELISIMRSLKCCPGFTSYSERRGYACLRLCPKGDNKLKVIKEEDGFLYSVYKEFVSKLE